MEALRPYEESRPWGSFRRFTLNEPTTVKILSVTRDEENSLQSHKNRDEFWRVLTGDLEIVIGEETHHAHPGDEFWVSAGTPHRLRGVGDDNRVLEIAFGTFDENDIDRINDKYGRV